MRTNNKMVVQGNTPNAPNVIEDSETDVLVKRIADIDKDVRAELLQAAERRIKEDKQVKYRAMNGIKITALKEITAKWFGTIPETVDHLEQKDLEVLEKLVLEKAVSEQKKLERRRKGWMWAVFGVAPPVFIVLSILFNVFLVSATINSLTYGMLCGVLYFLSLMFALLWRDTSKYFEIYFKNHTLEPYLESHKYLLEHKDDSPY